MYPKALITYLSAWSKDMQCMYILWYGDYRTLVSWNAPTDTREPAKWSALATNRITGSTNHELAQLSYHIISYHIISYHIFSLAGS